MAEPPPPPAAGEPPPHFPDDVLIEIFLNLPVRSLFIFRSVSKHWLNLIQNPNFIDSHSKHSLKNQPNKNPLLILRSIKSEAKPTSRNSKKIVLSLLSDDETLGCYRDEVELGVVSSSMVSRGVSFEEGKLHLLGPCKGVFCLTDTFEVVVFNPSTRECRRVPRSCLGSRSRDQYFSGIVGYFDCVGFGFDSVADDFKVVKFHESYEEEKFNDRYLDTDIDIDYDNDENYHDDDDGYSNGSDSPKSNHHYKVEIYSLSTDCWRVVDKVVPAGDMTRLHSYNMFYKGAFHWLGGDDEFVISILVFDLHKESFKLFQLPESYDIEDDETRVYLSILNGSLALIVRTESDPSLHLDDEFDIWVMKKYGAYNSWKKVCTIPPVIDIERPLSFGKGWEFLLENSDGHLTSYNLKTKVSKEFHIHGISGSMFAFRFRESLVSLKRSKRKRM